MIVFGAAVGSDDFVVAGCVERATISVWVPLPHWPTTCRSSLRVWPAQAWEEGEDAADEEGEVAEKGQSADEGENAEDAEKNAATMARIWRMNQWMLHRFKLASNAHYAGHVNFSLGNEEQLEETIKCVLVCFKAP